MNRIVEKPSDSPGEDVEAWREDWRIYVEFSYETGKGKKAQSWEEVTAEIPPEALRKNGKENGDQEGHPRDEENVPENKVEDSSESSEVEGELPPLVPEGLKIMVCIDYELRQTRYGPKDYLYWIDEDTGETFIQYFNHPDKYRYKKRSKAVRNYIVAMRERPKRLDRISLRHLIGINAEVEVVTVKPKYRVGATLKGQTMPECMHYSRVSEVLRPLGRVDTDTLNQLRKKC